MGNDLETSEILCFTSFCSNSRERIFLNAKVILFFERYTAATTNFIRFYYKLI